MVNIRKVQHGDENNLAYIQTESWKEAFKDIVPADLLSKYNGIERATAMCVQSDFMKNMASRRAEESSLHLARLRRCMCAGCDMGINKSKFIYLILRNPCIFKENRHYNVRSLCIFPCFRPYEPKQGKLFV